MVENSLIGEDQVDLSIKIKKFAYFKLLAPKRVLNSSFRQMKKNSKYSFSFFYNF
jgi:hypothetical protein